MHSELLPQIKKLPDSPGVYLMQDKRGAIIYIGKASSLKKRVGSYFHRHLANDRTGLLVSQVKKIDVISTSSEAEALLLEASLVKQHRPKFNIDLKDDKSYPFLKITLGEEYPRLLVTRRKIADGSVYYGPFVEAGLLRQAVSILRRLFPMRTCHPILKRLCLMYHIGQCTGPCVGQMTQEAYLQIVRELMMFLDGRRTQLIQDLAKRMREHSGKREYEQAARLRDQIQALSTVKAVGRVKPGREVLSQLKEALSLPHLPRRIEAFDISNISGKQAVGSMVVFLDGKPARSEYRRFRIREVSGVDDYRMMREVVKRRYTRVLNERLVLPDLVVIDGGRGHLKSAKQELNLLNLNDLPVIGIAKEHEHLFSYHRASPYIFPQSSPILHLIQHLRDEAHRFAIQYHRLLRKKEQVLSELDEIEGVGPRRKKLLLDHFRSLKRLKKASGCEIKQVKGIDEKTANQIVSYFSRERALSLHPPRLSGDGGDSKG